MSKALQDLEKYNTHWQTRTWEKSSNAYQRNLFHTLQKHLSSRFMLSIEGLRRTGKSVLQRQLVDSYVQSTNCDLINVMFFTFEVFDDFELLPSSVLEDYLDTYFRQILRVEPQQLNQKVLIAFDEIQNVKNWQAVLKRYYDLSENIKFIVTGSSSLYLHEGSESLVGRILDFKLQPLCFQEFLGLGRFGVTAPFISSLHDLDSLSSYSPSLDAIEAFHNFLLIGGFPDAVKMFSEGIEIREIQYFLRESIINKIISKDLKKYFNLDSSLLDLRLFEICCEESSNFLNLSNLSRDTAVSLPTVKRHLEIFRKSSLTDFLYKFDRKLRRAIKASKKLYVASPCLMYTQSYKDHTQDSHFLGHAVETYAFQRLSEHTDNLYVEQGRKNQEIDFLLERDKLLIECKYTNRFREKELDYLLERSQALNYQARVLTKNYFYAEKRYLAVPAMVL